MEKKDQGDESRSGSNAKETKLKAKTYKSKGVQGYGRL
jgi:hypothetical protein